MQTKCIYLLLSKFKHYSRQWLFNNLDPSVEHLDSRYLKASQTQMKKKQNMDSNSLSES